MSSNPPPKPQSQKQISGLYKIISALDIGTSCYNQLRTVDKNDDHNFGDEGAGDEDQVLRKMLEGSDGKENIKTAPRAMLLVVELINYNKTTSLENSQTTKCLKLFEKSQWQIKSEKLRPSAVVRLSGVALFNQQFLFIQNSNIKLERDAGKFYPSSTQNSKKGKEKKEELPKNANADDKTNIKTDQPSLISELTTQLSKNASVTPTRLRPLRKRPRLESKNQSSKQTTNQQLEDEDFEDLNFSDSESISNLSLGSDFSIVSDGLTDELPEVGPTTLKVETATTKTKIGTLARKTATATKTEIKPPKKRKSSTSSNSLVKLEKQVNSVICLDSSDESDHETKLVSVKQEKEKPLKSQKAAKLKVEIQEEPTLWATPCLAQLLNSSSSKVLIVKNILIINSTLSRMVFTDGTATAVSFGDTESVFKKYYEEQDGKFDSLIKKTIHKHSYIFQLERRMPDFEKSLKLEIKKIVRVDKIS